MRSYSMIFPTFWTGETGKKMKKMGKDCQLLALYLLTSPHVMGSQGVGIYYLPLDYMVHDTGLDGKALTKALQRAIEGGFCKYDDVLEYVWVVEMAKFQIGKLRPLDKQVLGIKKILSNLPVTLCFLYDFYQKYQGDFHLQEEAKMVGPSKGLTIPLRSHEHEHDQEHKDLTTLSSSASLTRRRVISGGDDAARSIIDYLNRVTGKKFEFAGSHIAMINARLKEGATIEKCKAVIDHQFELWKNEPGMWRYLRPPTLFNATKFASYVGELGVEKPKIKNDFELLQEKYRLEDLAAQQGEQNEAE